MRQAPTSLTGTALAFDRSGNRLLALEADALAVVELARGGVKRLPVPGARAVAGFDDQLWLATASDELVRMDYAGYALGPAIPLGFAAQPLLLAAPCGLPAAIWASAPAVAVIDDFGQPVRTELADADLVIPLTGRRHVSARGSRVTLPSGLVTALAPGVAVAGGQVTTDGKTLVLLTTSASERQLLVISLANGQIMQRRTIAAGLVRMATQALIVVAQVAPTTLLISELRSGRELGLVALPYDVREFAIDPNGRQLVTRAADGLLEVHVLADLLHAAVIARAQVTDEYAVAAVAVADSEPAAVADPDSVAVAVAASEGPAPLPVPGADDASCPSRSAVPCPPLLALDPRPLPPPIDRTHSLSHLDLELRRIQLWALAAIAEGWDTRRIGYGNEGRHPYELEVAAILGLNHGHASEHLAAARGALADHEELLAARPGRRDASTPLGRLVTELGLSPRAVDVLLVIAAPALVGETARLYGILANDASRPHADELVVQQVLAGRHARRDLAAELDPRSPLVRLGLVHLSARRPRPFAELSVDPVVLDLLTATAPDLGDAITLRTSELALADLAIPRAALDSAIAALAVAPSAASRIAVRGRSGTGRKTVLGVLAREAGRQLAIIDLLALPRGAEPFVLELRQALRTAHLAGHVPCLANLDELMFDERPAREVAAETLRVHPGPIAVITSHEAPAPFAAGHIAITLPTLPESERVAVWQRAVTAAGLVDVRTDVLAARYRVGPGVIHRAVAAACANGNPELGATAALEDYIRQTRDARLGLHAKRVERLASWSNVVLPPDILDPAAPRRPAARRPRRRSRWTWAPWPARRRRSSRRWRPRR